MEEITTFQPLGEDWLINHEDVLGNTMVCRKADEKRHANGGEFAFVWEKLTLLKSA